MTLAWQNSLAHCLDQTQRLDPQELTSYSPRDKTKMAIAKGYAG